MKLNKDYKIGLRAIKTSIAVFVCALISMFFSHEDMFCACIASVICMEQTYEQTLNTGVNRFIGTMIGGVIGYIALEFCYMFSYHELLRICSLPICILLVVYICNFISRKSAVSIGCVVVIVILSRSGSSANNTLNYVVERVFDTLIGVFVAMLINSFYYKKVEN